MDLGYWVRIRWVEDPWNIGLQQGIEDIWFLKTSELCWVFFTFWGQVSGALSEPLEKQPWKKYSSSFSGRRKNVRRQVQTTLYPELSANRCMITWMHRKRVKNYAKGSVSISYCYYYKLPYIYRLKAIPIFYLMVLKFRNHKWVLPC